MPIHKMKFEGGIFFAKPVGYFDNCDARMWANALKNHAKSSSAPIIAVVDCTEVDRCCSTVTKIMTDTLNNPQLKGLVVAAGDLMASQKARMLGVLSECGGVRIFSTGDEARTYADARVGPAPSGARWSVAGASY